MTNNLTSGTFRSRVIVTKLEQRGFCSPSTANSGYINLTFWALSALVKEFLIREAISFQLKYRSVFSDFSMWMFLAYLLGITPKIPRNAKGDYPRWGSQNSKVTFIVLSNNSALQFIPHPQDIFMVDFYFMYWKSAGTFDTSCSVAKHSTANSRRMRKVHKCLCEHMKNDICWSKQGDEISLHIKDNSQNLTF